MVDKSMNSLSIQDHTNEISGLMATGLQCLYSMLDADPKKKVRFSDWCKHVQKVHGSALKSNKLIWLWDSITTEPHNASLFVGRLFGIDDEWRDLPCDEPVLGPETELLLFMQGIQTQMAFKGNETDPSQYFPHLRLEKPLYFAPGKSRRLVCQDVKVKLTLHLPDIGTRSEEAKWLSVDEDQISMADGSKELTVSLPSLNMAYTVASRRLEPKRRNPGGRIYDHLAFKSEIYWVPLDQLRMDVEAMQWIKLMGADTEV